MTRDPLCTNGHGDAVTADCSMCDLIAKVRENERERCVTAVTCWTDTPVHVDGERNMVFVDEAVYQIRNPSQGHPDWCFCGVTP